MCWEWEEQIYRNWLKQQKKQEESQKLAVEKGAEEVPEAKEKKTPSQAPIYKYLKPEKGTEEEGRRKVVKAR